MFGIRQSYKSNISKMTMKVFVNLGLVFTTLFARHCVMGYNITDIKMIKKALLVDTAYDRTIRPVVNQSQVVEIQIAFAATSILDFDLASGRIAMTGYLFASWVDEQLQWNPLQFNGIQSVMLSKDLVWTPGLRNAFDLKDSFAVSRVIVYANGHVTWLPANVFSSICNVDITYYPYDEHTCDFPIFSDSDDDTTIRFVPMANTVNMKNFNDHGEWEAIATKSSVTEVEDPDIQMSVSTFLSSITLKRRPKFAVLHTYFPLLLLYFLNILTFLVPLDKGERVSYTITLLLALIFFTSSTSATFPRSSLNTSYFSSTMTLAICASTLGVMLSVILVRLDHETIRQVPPVLCLMTRSFKRRKRDGLFCCDKNAVVVFKESNHEITDGDKPANTDHDKKLGVDKAAEPVTWSDVAEALNMIVFWIYSAVLVLSVIVLIVLHH